MQSTSRYQAYYRLAPVRGWFVHGEPKKIRRTDSSALLTASCAFHKGQEASSSNIFLSILPGFSSR